MSRWKGYVSNLCILLISSIFSIALIEAYVSRFVWYGESIVTPGDPFARQQSPNARFSYQGAVFAHDCVHNSDGFREKELPASVRRGSGKRVVFIGDSFTYGWGVNNPHCFVRRTERLLQDSDGSDVWEVINLGVFGTHMMQYRDVLYTYGPQLKPNIVVICLYLPNDSVDWYWPPKRDRRPTRFWRDLARLYPKHTFQYATNIWKWKQTHKDNWWNSAPPDNPLMKLLESTDPVVQEKLKRIESGPLDMALRWELSPYHPAYSVTRGQDMLGYHIETNNKSIRTAIPYRILQEMKDEVSTWGGELRLVLIPMGWTIERPLLESFKKFGYDMSPTLLDDRRIQDTFGQYAEQLGITYLDMRPFLLNQPARVYLDLDDHMTVFGHRQTAAILSKWLRPELSEPPQSSLAPDCTDLTNGIRWDFDNTNSEWKPEERSNQVAADGGLLRIQSGAATANILNKTADLDCSAVNRFRVRMKSDRGTFAQLYWGRGEKSQASGAEFSESRVAVFPIVADGAFHEYDLSLEHAVSTYTGTWKELKFQPAGLYKDAGDMTGATIEIDWMALGHCDSQHIPENIWHCLVR